MSEWKSHMSLVIQTQTKGIPGGSWKHLIPCNSMGWLANPTTHTRTHTSSTHTLMPNAAVRSCMMTHNDTVTRITEAELNLFVLGKLLVLGWVCKRVWLQEKTKKMWMRKQMEEEKKTLVLTIWLRDRTSPHKLISSGWWCEALHKGFQGDTNPREM